MSVWLQCEQVHPPLAREDVRLWTSTSVTLFTRGGPRLVLETGGPFSLSGIVITLPVSPRLEVQHKGPLALDFRIQLVDVATTLHHRLTTVPPRPCRVRRR